MNRTLSTGSVCRVCGCSDANACIIDLPTGDVLTDETLGLLTSQHPYSELMTRLAACYWIEPDLCSACVPIQSSNAAEAPPLLYDAEGRPLRGAP
jgi:hypothetical protein